MAAEEMRVVYTTSNDTPGWVPGRVYQGRIEGENIVYDYGEAPNGIEITPYDSKTKNSIEYGFNVVKIEGEKEPPYSQDDLEEIYLKQHKDNLGFLKTLNSLVRLKRSGGKRSKRKRPKRKTKRKK